MLFLIKIVSLLKLQAESESTMAVRGLELDHASGIH
jgi:hypothetical protein